MKIKKSNSYLGLPWSRHLKFSKVCRSELVFFVTIYKPKINANNIVSFVINTLRNITRFETKPAMYSFAV